MAVPQFLARYLRAVVPEESDVPGLEGLCKRGKVASTCTDVATYIAGPENPVATVVFVHGFTLAAESFFLQVKHLQELHPEVRCLLLDLRGHGQTGEVPPEECTVDGAADDVMNAIAQQCPTGPLILVGHSLGGHVVLNVIRRATEGLYQRMAGVILIATSIDSLSTQGLPRLLNSHLGDRVYSAMETTPEAIGKFRDDVSKFLAPALAATVFKRVTTPYNLVKFHAEMIRETPLSTFLGYFDDLETNSELGAAERLSALPGFVLVGNDDHYTPLAQSRRIMEVWPKAELIRSGRVGHMMILEAPELVNGAIDKLLDAVEAEKHPETHGAPGCSNPLAEKD